MLIEHGVSALKSALPVHERSGSAGREMAPYGRAASAHPLEAFLDNSKPARVKQRSASADRRGCESPALP
jgi:hypothetical protein